MNASTLIIVIGATMDSGFEIVASVSIVMTVAGAQIVFCRQICAARVTAF